MVEDWQLTIEMLLQWRMWLKQDKLSRELVIRAKRKFRYLMALIRKVVHREKGMGMKIVKFHAIMHIPQDILDFGVPMEVDTGANEAGHKSEKKASRLTQRRKETFDEQTQNRLIEMELLELAAHELEGYAPWTYFKKNPDEVQVATKYPPPKLVGDKFRIVFSEQSGNYHHDPINKEAKAKDVNYPGCMLYFVGMIQEKLEKYQKNLVLRTTYKRFGHIFRANMDLHPG